MYKINVKHNERMKRFILAVIDYNVDAVDGIGRKHFNAVTEVNKVYMTELLKMENENE